MIQAYANGYRVAVVQRYNGPPFDAVEVEYLEGPLHEQRRYLRLSDVTRIDTTDPQTRVLAWDRTK